MDFSGLNSNPVVFDTTSNVRKALPLDEEDDEVIDEVPRAKASKAVPPRGTVVAARSTRASDPRPCALRWTRWRYLT